MFALTMSDVECFVCGYRGNAASSFPSVLQVLTVAFSGPADPEILPPSGAEWSDEATEAV